MVIWVRVGVVDSVYSVVNRVCDRWCWGRGWGIIMDVWGIGGFRVWVCVVDVFEG